MKEIYAIGLMSGTSLDGLDIAYVKFIEDSTSLTYKIIQTETIPYNKDWFTSLQNAKNTTSHELKNLNNKYGHYLGEQTNKFIINNNIKKLDFIASHGHTVFHQPEKGITLQIGKGEHISELTQKTVVYDFRIQDVLLGGQGAPLVPIGDQLLFSEYDACLNLGGFSNISLEINGKRIAFDISPVNIVLNKYAQKLGFEYDDKGEIASSGQLIPDLLNALNTLEYYSNKGPKSLGIEWVEKNIYPLISNDLFYEDILHTFTHHIAEQINIVTHEHSIRSLLITGGGAYNEYLISLLKAENIGIPDREVLEYKEAMIFALLGWLCLEKQVNVLSSVTGATRDHCSGKISFPNQ